MIFLSLYTGGLYAAKKEIAGRSWNDPDFMVLCYHNVPDEKITDKHEIDLKSFVMQMDFMRDYGCSFISVNDIIMAKEGLKKLPPKAVLLTFDDAYSSFYTNVMPILKIYNAPAVLAIVGRWIDEAPDVPEYKHGFMTWEQLKEIANSGLVEIASHSFDSHKAAQCNPQGNTAPALVTRIYSNTLNRYETEDEYRKRIFEDIKKSQDILFEKTGIKPRVIVWPFGRYTGECIDAADELGFKAIFTLDDGLANTSNIKAIPRHMLVSNPRIADFVTDFKKLFTYDERLRILQADLDLVYDKNPEIQAANVDKFIERVNSIKPSAVYLQAYSDDGADGNIASVYFPNRILPMKADLFNRVCRALNSRGIQVYAWMPVLSIVLPDKNLNEKLRIKELRNGQISNSSSWYTNRLSPFSEEAVSKLETLYEDLAANSLIDGIVFQDDAYLNDFEDFSEYGMAEFLKTGASSGQAFNTLSPEQKKQWTEAKTRKINELTLRLKQKVRYYRPTAVFARTVYPLAVTKPESEEWFAQNYESCLANYDYTVIMAYPEMEKISDADDWLRSLVKKASQKKDALKKTVFKTQAYDWDKKKWISSEKLRSRLRTLMAAGAFNIAYYPDDYTVNEPDINIIRTVISVENYPGRN